MLSTILLFSPLEQFDVVSLPKVHSLIGGFIWLALAGQSTLHLYAKLPLVILVFSVLLLEGIVSSGSPLISMFRDVYKGLLQLSTSNLGALGRYYFPMIFTIFMFISLANLCGMIPYGFTLTAHFFVTFSLAISVFVAITLFGFQFHGIKFFSFFLPEGIPVALAPFLIPIEFVLYLFRSISLGTRLFANLMSGHTLLKILLQFAGQMMFAFGVVPFFGLLCVALIAVLILMEFAIALLQGYVFAMLVAIYLSDAVRLH